MSPFMRGFFWLHPPPYHRDFHRWINGMATSCTLILLTIPAAILFAAFLLGRAS